MGDNARPEEATPADSGLFHSLKGLLATFVATAHTRLELLATEVEEEKLRVFSLLTLIIAAVFTLLLGVVLAIALVVAAFWDNRIAVLGGLTVLSFTAFALLARRFQQVAKRGSPLFAHSLAELREDLRRLRGRE